jgi:beta-ureidopropionase / N-carbamoyl-L-amino-acid hydrolase
MDMAQVNGERLKASLLSMAEIGKTAGGGVTRPALTDTDRAARDQLAAWAAETGLQVRIDDLGTLYARLEGIEPDAAPILIGSHLDSVPAGGKFDGALGVLTGLEVVRAVVDAGVRLRRPVEIADFTNEEGVRFEPAMMASGCLAGRFTPEFVYSRSDRDGRTFGAELERIGYKGSPANRPRAFHAYLEVHIEQGPVLEAEGLPLAAVDGILGLVWMNVTVTGQPQHAGPSPMRSRRDPMVAAARMVAGLRDLAMDYPDPVTATVGRLEPVPGVINQIPGQVVMSVDVRHWTTAGLTELSKRAQTLMRAIAAEEGVDVLIDPFWRIDPTAFDPRLVDLVESEIRRLGDPPRRMTSGAGHDAKYMSEIGPTAMLFVRTVGGKSHCETEAVHWPDVTAAAEVLLAVVQKLAE